MAEPVSQEALMRYLDGESPADERERIRLELEASTELRREFSIFRAIQEDLRDLSFQPPDPGGSVWDTVHRKIARPTAWLLIVAGSAIWSVYAVYVFLTSSTRLLEKLSIGAIVVGFVILLAGICWEQYTAWRNDPYRKVHR